MEMVHKQHTKIVMVPVEVAYGAFCLGAGKCCPQLDCVSNDCPTCSLGFILTNYDENGNVPKPLACLSFK